MNAAAPAAADDSVLNLLLASDAAAPETDADWQRMFDSIYSSDATAAAAEHAPRN